MLRTGRFCVLVLALAWTLFFGGSGDVLAQTGNDSTAGLVDQAGDPFTTASISMFLVPDGTGTPFTNCWLWPGIPVSVELRVRLRDSSGPVGGVSADRIRLEEAAPSPTVVWCNDAFYPPPAHAPNLADFPTDALGRTRFTMAYHGGGWARAPTYVWVYEPPGTWAPIASTPLDINYNSADINGDLVVNLTDVALFASDVYGAYDYRSDFNFDGEVNLIDLVIFAPTIGASCP
jgi:hypothetical protein